jgi:hypothetical protein
MPEERMMPGGECNPDRMYVDAAYWKECIDTEESGMSGRKSEDQQKQQGRREKPGNNKKQAITMLA